MPNHYHIELFVDQDECDYASAKDVVERWHKSDIIRGPWYLSALHQGEFFKTHELELLDSLSLNCRKHLQNISWVFAKSSNTISLNALTMRSMHWSLG